MSLYGYSDDQSAQLLSVIGVAQTIGMIFLGWAGDQPWLNVIKVYAGCLGGNLKSQFFFKTFFKNYFFLFFSLWCVCYFNANFHNKLLCTVGTRNYIWFNIRKFFLIYTNYFSTFS